MLFRRRRTWAMLLALAAIPVLIAVAVRLPSAEPAPGRGPPFLDRVTQNGLFVGITGLVVSIPLFLPLTVGVVAGDTIAGEANLGTLRYLLVVPAGRVRLLLVKYAGAAAFCLAATVTVVAAGAAIGAALFPIGPVTLLSGEHDRRRRVRAEIAARGRLRHRVAAGPVRHRLVRLHPDRGARGRDGGHDRVVVVSQVLGALPQLEWLHPWLFTHYWLDFADLLRQPISWTSFADNALLQAGYALVFGALAYGRFVTKDILS